MEQSIEYPGLIWVKDPIDLDGNPTGGPPRRRHHEECWHFYRAADGTLLGPAPYRASDEQMQTLSACQTCAESMPGSGGSRAPSKDGRRGDICETCFMERPLIGPCPNCGDE